jgi:Zn-dependent peptidase ImmA (M78 family)/transcriptional regulator with XRE-family HTH domain
MTDSPARLAARRRRAAGTLTDFDGARLALARRLARQPRTALAASTSVTAAAITQYERGQARPTAPVLAELSLALGVPADFFRHGQPIQALSPNAAHFRSLRATPALARDQALAFAELALAVVEVVEQYVDLPSVDLPEFPVAPDAPAAAVAEAARATRAHFQMASGPISHVVRLLEAHGVLVLRLPDDCVDRRVDAFSTRATTRPLVLLSPMKDDKARSRFDAAHELGHLVMHPDVEPGSKIVESQAHAFAAEFLMPADQVQADLPQRVDWERLHAAKRRWGTSLRALVYRAHALGLLSEPAYRRANMQLAQEGNPEAGPLGPPESPTLLGSALKLLAEHGTTVDQLAGAARLPLEQVHHVLRAGSDTRPRLELPGP